MLQLTPVQWYGIILVACGLLLRYLVARKIYYWRIRAATSPPPKYLTTIVRALISWFFTWLGTVSVLSGVFLLLIEYYNSR